MMVLIDYLLIHGIISLIFLDAFVSIFFVSVLRCLLTVRLLWGLCRRVLVVSLLLLSFEGVCHSLFWLMCRRTSVVNF